MNYFGYKGLRWKIIISTLCFSLIPLCALGLTIYYLFYESYESKVKEDLVNILESKRNAIEIFLKERVAQLNVLATVVGCAELENQVYLEQVFNIIEGQTHSFVDLGVIDIYGNQVAYVGPYPLRHLNYAKTEWFRTTLIRGKYISDVFLGYRNIPHFVVALVARKGDEKCVVRATIDSDIFNDIVRAADISRTGNAFIINRHAVFQTKPRLGQDIGDGSQHFELTRSPSGNYVREMELGSGKAIVATSWVKNNEWLLVLKQKPEEELKPVFRARSIGAVLFFGGILVIVLGTVFTTQLMMVKLIRIAREKAVLDDTLVHSSKMAALGKLAAGIAHEVNNPLSVIKEKAGWMKDMMQRKRMEKPEDLERFQAAVVNIDFHVERAKKVTHRLLGFARRIEPVRETVFVNDLIDQTIGFLSNEALYRNIKLNLAYSENLPAIQSDPAQLQQVFLNLLNNAIDAVGKDGEITIKTSHHPETGEISVAFRDTGVGIPARDLKRVFDPFFTTKRTGEGTGLGLSISYGVVEKLGGKMAVETDEGKGSTFTVILPLETQ
jgi:two-component system, NtrC family, sensor kinase